MYTNYLYTEGLTDERLCVRVLVRPYGHVYVHTYIYSMDAHARHTGRKQTDIRNTDGWKTRMKTDRLAKKQTHKQTQTEADWQICVAPYDEAYMHV